MNKIPYSLEVTTINFHHHENVQVDFATKPQFWRTLHPPIKEKLGELLVIIIVNIIIISITITATTMIIIIDHRHHQVSLSYHPSSNTLTIAVLKVAYRDILQEKMQCILSIHDCRRET